MSLEWSKTCAELIDMEKKKDGSKLIVKNINKRFSGDVNKIS